MKYITYINDAGRKLGETIQREMPEFSLIEQKEFPATDCCNLHWSIGDLRAYDSPDGK